MFEHALIHPRTKAKLTSFINKPTHGLLLTGPDGSGKSFLAKKLAGSLLRLSDNKLLVYPYIMIVEAENLSITIDQARQAQRILNLKTTGSSDQLIKRIIIIKDAQRMGIEAQNAFLKTLEEPPLDTCLILTATNTDALLPTITSRCRLIEVLPVTKAAAKSFYSYKDIDSLYALSKGQAGLLSKLIEETDHQLKTSIKKAKQIIADPIDQRLLNTEELVADKDTGSNLLEAIKRVSEAALMAAAKSENKKLVEKWQKTLKVISFTETAIKGNANAKLVFDNLLLNL